MTILVSRQAVDSIGFFGHLEITPPLPNRSGAVQGGVAAFIEAIRQSVEEAVKKN
jgi:hypothetical protein